MNKKNTGNPVLDLTQDMGEKAKKLENKPSTALTPQDKVELFFVQQQAIFKTILPAHLSIEKLRQYAIISFRKVPKLGECDIASIMGAIMECAQLGLEPHSALGQAYILPFKNNKTGKYMATFVIGYKGLLELFYRTGQIAGIRACPVYEKDHFEYDNGAFFISHIPYQGDYRDRGKVTHYYAAVKFINGGVSFEVMTVSEMEHHKKLHCPSSKYSGSAWVLHPDAMASKTVLKRCGKYIPKSQQLVRAVYADEQVKLDPFSNPIPEQKGELLDIPNAEVEENIDV